jgi:hypothetical protein
MTLPLNQYAKVKDKYCISYLGDNIEYIAQLLYVRKAIEQEFPGISIYICCKSKHVHLVNGDNKIIPLEKINKDTKRQFACVRTIQCDQISHPILNLIEESNVTLCHLPSPIRKNTHNKKCVIYPNGNLPVQSLSKEEVTKIVRYCQKQGYNPTVVSDHTTENFGWAIGVECMALFYASCQGIKTSLVPTGVGTRLYQKLFPSMEIINLLHI